MLNYIKSELYRITHEKEIYLTTFTISGLTVLMNLVLFFFAANTSAFGYATTRYSFNMLTGSINVVPVCAALYSMQLFGEEYKNGTMKNAFAFGITRTQFFAGKCIAIVFACVMSLLVILFCYLGSGYLLVENAGTEPLRELILGLLSSVPTAVASVILTTGFMCILQKSIHTVIGWYAISLGVPLITFLLGFKLPWFNKAAEWMPYNFYRMEVSVNMGEYSCLWDTSAGMAKCLLAGVIGMMVFYVIFILLFRKREI